MGTTLSAEVQAAAERLRQAATLRRPCRSLHDLVGDDLDAALAVQRHVLALQAIGGATRVGGKVGRERAGGARSTGVLLDEMRVPDGTRLATSRLLQPRVELKLAVAVVRDLGPDPASWSLDDVRSRTAVTVALEVTDSRIAGRCPSLVDEVCDNAGAGRFVLGAEPVELGEADPAARSSRLEVDAELTWRGSVCVDAALSDLRTVASAWRAAGDQLRVGQTVLSAAAGPALPAVEGQHYSGHVDGLGSVTIGFTTSRLARTEGHL